MSLLSVTEWLSVGAFASTMFGLAVGLRHLRELRDLKKTRLQVDVFRVDHILGNERQPVFISHTIPRPRRSRRRFSADLLAFYASWLESPHAGLRQKAPPRIDIPAWSLVLLSHDDAERYRREFGAHLWQLVTEEQFNRARRERRRFAVAAVTLAVVLRVRHVLVRARPR